MFTAFGDWVYDHRLIILATRNRYEPNNPEPIGLELELISPNANGNWCSHFLPGMTAEKFTTILNDRERHPDV